MTDDSPLREAEAQDYNEERGKTNIPPALSSSFREYFRDDTS